MQDFIITEFNQKIVELAQIQSQFTGSIGATQATSTMEESSTTGGTIAPSGISPPGGNNSIESNY